MTEYIIGIDLGTSNCSLSYRKNGEQESKQLEIFEKNEDGLECPSYCLPSFMFFPLEEEKIEKEAFYLGHYARKRGIEQPKRVLSSAKSWLCHGQLNRREAFLPLHADQQMSPLNACVHYLKALKKSWDRQFPSAAFDEQSLFITVPASFDPSARQLVEEAAQMASCAQAVFLEEPQSAFYSWLDKKGDAWRKELFVGDTVLVVDIGGGTSDFSLIGVADQEGDLSLERLAVGEHLLLGGDNMDLALAHFLLQKIEKDGHKIDQWQFQELLARARLAKEAIFEGQESMSICLSGKGSSFLSGSIETVLELSEIEKIIADGFFPILSSRELPKQKIRSGFQQIGLPFESDARITAHIASFLSKAGGERGFVLPSAILLNGGVFKALPLQKRLKDIFSNWALESGLEPPRILDASDLSYAVSRGAVYYGLSRQGKAVRIKSGVSHNYYIGIEEPSPAVPGMEIPIKALCVVPFGLEEGSQLDLDLEALYLLLGQKSSFRFFSKKPALDEAPDQIGNLIPSKGLQEHHPIETQLDDAHGDTGLIKVSIRSCVSELGLLELYCIAADGQQWKLEFDLRSEAPQGILST